MKNLVFYLIFGVFFNGCLIPQDFVSENKPQKVKKEKANLPPSPKLKQTDFPVMYADGSYTVHGFISKIKENLGKDVTVKGYVYQKNICPPDAKVCDAAPHLYIVDDIYTPRTKLLVVGPANRIIYEFEEKKGYSFTGKASYFSSDSRFVKVEGLLVLPEKPVEIK